MSGLDVNPLQIRPFMISANSSIKDLIHDRSPSSPATIFAFILLHQSTRNRDSHPFNSFNALRTVRLE